MTQIIGGSRGGLWGSQIQKRNEKERNSYICFIFMFIHFYIKNKHEIFPKFSLWIPFVYLSPPLKKLLDLRLQKASMIFFYLVFKFSLTWN